MNRISTRTLLVFIPLLMLGFFIQPSQAQAWTWGQYNARGHQRPDRGQAGRHYYHDRYPFGRIEVTLPKGFIRIGIGTGRYYYCSGFFYRDDPRGYIVVPAPVGAVVYTLPLGWHKVVIDGVVYYTYDGVYYRPVRGGYQVVEAPLPVIVEPVTVVTNTPKNTAEEIFMVNIANSKGGYTAVEIRRSGTGFIGPQGEFYKEFPKVEQLRVMYAQ